MTLSLKGGSLVNPYGQPDHSISRFLKPSLTTWPRLPKNANAISSTFVFESSEPSYLLNSDLHCRAFLHSVGGNSRCVLRLSSPHCTHPHIYRMMEAIYPCVHLGIKDKALFKVIFFYLFLEQRRQNYTNALRERRFLHTHGLAKLNRLPLTVNINSDVGTCFFLCSK